jgi:hypothetical protein
MNAEDSTPTYLPVDPLSPDARRRAYFKDYRDRVDRHRMRSTVVAKRPTDTYLSGHHRQRL